MTCFMVSYCASANELELLDDIEEVAYGEIYDVKHTAGEPATTVQVSEKTRNFFKILKDTGHVTKVVIHDGEPTMAEFFGVTPSGLQCLKKMKM